VLYCHRNSFIDDLLDVMWCTAHRLQGSSKNIWRLQ